MWKMQPHQSLDHRRVSAAHPLKTEEKSLGLVHETVENLDPVRGIEEDLGRVRGIAEDQGRAPKIAGGDHDHEGAEDRDLEVATGHAQNLVRHKVFLMLPHYLNLLHVRKLLPNRSRVLLAHLLGSNHQHQPKILLWIGRRYNVHKSNVIS
mmetsp:Transcript_35230/g.56317  ORF Transcript_35230/g.56317 Transcript_35230/m.56317 type:complete len:151 (+) Transcript_35230:615-1067(+)